MESSYKHLLTAIVAALCTLTGCIVNDLPYPRIQANITEFLCNGLQSPAQIDTVARTITLQFDEETDLQNVRLLSYHLAPDGTYIDGGIPDTLNLIKPLRIGVSLYQEYIWTIRATQDIQRHFTIEGQLGSSVIDVPGRRVIVYVPRGTDLSALKVLTAKLGSTASTITPDPTGNVFDFILPLQFTLTDYGRQSTWTVIVEAIDAAVSIDRVEPWSRVAWLYADAEEGKDNGFDYRKQGDTDWQRVPQDCITHNGGSFSARLINLLPSTAYEVRAYSDLDITSTVDFTTDPEMQLPNAGFDNWWLDGKIYNPWAEGGTPFWDTGNKGATTLGTSNSYPTADTPSGMGLCAELKTEFKGVGSIGKIAAGNIFTGVYMRTEGTNGVLNFGREFSLRPTRLTATYKYNCAPISHVGTDTDFADWKGRPDSAQIFIALTDWPSALEIRTNPKNRQLFNPNDPAIIAYAQTSIGHTVDTWTKLDLQLQYRSTSRRPRYIVVVCTASKYGDYFVGGSGSMLTIDDLILEYDY